MNPSQTPTRPRDYAALSAGFGALLGALLLASRDKGDEPVRPEELFSLGIATFALAKLVSKEKADAWLREPFVDEGEGEPEPRGTGLRHVVGELLTCTRCTGVWSALGLVALRVTHPGESRMVTALLGASAVNDFAQAGFTWAEARTNAEQARAAQAAVAPSSG
ncbi:MAG: DUF1360 domain-containing protein [Solirubrobacteraceae bacterium MAG38_C4-C5]|nr:DUF1360 domain-containing protein [Candidatus Siliceabacter maunaloa]